MKEQLGELRVSFREEIFALENGFALLHIIEDGKFAVDHDVELPEEMIEKLGSVSLHAFLRQPSDICVRSCWRRRRRLLR